MSYSTGRADAADREALITLGESVHASFATHRRFDHWFHRHPTGEVHIATVLDEAGRIVGASWVFPLPIRYRNERRVLAQVGELVVHPDHRGGFAYALLARQVNRIASEVAPAHISIVSDATFERHRQARPKSVGTMPWLTRIVDAEGWARAYAGRRGWPSAAVALGALAKGFAPIRRRPRSASLRLATGVDALRGHDPEGAGHEAGLAAIDADPDYLWWRFGPDTGRDYQYLAGESPNGERGLVVYRLTQEGKAFVCFLDCPSTRLAATLLAVIEEQLIGMGGQMLSALVPHQPHITDAFRQRGFLANPARRWRRLEGLWPASLPISIVRHDALPPGLADAQSWAPGLAVHETI
ncbi:MAG: GNAT family N-acetyltransferase [Gemmatimonadota bacterium]